MVHEMKSFRKPMALVLSFLVAFTCSAALFRTSSRAATYGDLETEGWEVDENGKMTVATNTAMANCNWNNGVEVKPGDFQRIVYKSVKSLEITGEVSYVRESAFDGFIYLESLSFTGNKMTEIQKHAFRDCMVLTSVEFPSTLTTIGVGAFEGCLNLPSVTLPSSLTTINASTFKTCTSLASVTFPSSLTSINDSAFENCTSLETVTLPSSLTTICNSAFAASGLKSIVIPASVTYVESNIFYDCNYLTSVTISSSDTEFMPQEKPVLETLNFAGSKKQHESQLSKLSGFIGEGTTVNYGSFDVEFDYNYSGCPESSWGLAEGGQIAKPEDPTREGYSFEGWYRESACTNLFDFASEVTSDMTLYAKWAKTSNSVLEGYKLTLDGDIGVNFYISLTDAIKSDSQAKLVFSRTVGDKVIEEESAIDKYIDTDPERDCFIYKINISPAEMTCPITIKIVDGSQTEYQLGVFKAQRYAEKLIFDGDASRKLCIALLNYGTYCQQRFGINTSDLANSKIADMGYDEVAQTAVEDVTPVSITGDLSTVEYYGSSLDLRSNTDAYLYFSYEGSLSGITATVDGEAVDVVANKTSGYFNIRIPAIRANLLVHGFTVVITRGGESLTVVYNPLIYCDGVANGTTASEESLVNLVKALYLYADAADRYFN